ncbi:hypothetical protein C7M71_007375 [Peterkaempfera bronchialis]|uniref:4'-phosphopantetheinyl transferase domain-containing protein n=1 Tax=Peterkaempfera bronchialis TaxID=2126346 RepID=A0A345SU84_9ACTN|nr:hypothetical protein C7M71_007375 [Peterkaempfera bronchialis]
MLSAPERARLARMPAAAQSSYATAHALLRLVLAPVLRVAPERVGIGRDSAGRPLVEGAPWLHISLSHTAGAVLAGFSTTGPFGVDIERVRPLRMPGMLAERVLDPADLARWAGAGQGGTAGAAGAARSQAALLRRWTCKEAVLKACGTGLPGGVSRVVAWPDPHHWSVPGVPGLRAGSLWRTAEPQVGAGHVAAVAVPAGSAGSAGSAEFAVITGGRSDQALLEGQCHSQGAVGGVELGEQVGDVPLDPVFGDGESAGDLLVAEALRQQREDLLLAGGERDLAG